MTVETRCHCGQVGVIVNDDSEVTSVICSECPALDGRDYPALVKIWDNEDDAVYD